MRQQPWMLLIVLVLLASYQPAFTTTTAFTVNLSYPIESTSATATLRSMDTSLNMNHDSNHSDKQGDRANKDPEDDPSPLTQHQNIPVVNNGHSESRAQTASSQQRSQKISKQNKLPNSATVGRLEELKRREEVLAAQLAAVRREKLNTLQSRPLRIGVVGYGRFGQFISNAFCRHGHEVVVTSRSDYTSTARAMGATYVPWSEMQQFFDYELDVIVLGVSILSFEETAQNLLPYFERDLQRRSRGPLVVDVLSVKEHPRRILLDVLPQQVDLLLTHPMFGPDSGKDGWHGLNFVYEKTRIDGVLLDPERSSQHGLRVISHTDHEEDETFVDMQGKLHSVHEQSESHVEAVDRMERFLSIWEEEGCQMVQMSCREHDEFAANSQFITHLVGRVLGSQGLKPTPIDTSGFRNVLKLIERTTADSFDLFHGLYQFNSHSQETITNLKEALDDVVDQLQSRSIDEADTPPTTMRDGTRKHSISTSTTLHVKTPDQA